jgi:hypothetical protein
MHLSISKMHIFATRSRDRISGLARQGFTLFEVAISLVIVSFGVVSILMLFPVGIRVQMNARFQIYAAAKAEEMIESFNCSSNGNPAIDTEGCMPWDTSGGYRAQAWDLEARLSSHRFGIMPLPLALAQRLDSDNDEIQQVLSQGGNIYYSQPLATTETEEQGNPKAPPNDAQKLIFTVSGYAQQNALTLFAMKNWPYTTPMPSPPLAPSHMPDLWLPNNGSQGGNAYWSYALWPNDQVNNEEYCFAWESIPSNLDPDMHVVYDWPLTPGSQHIGYFPYACGTINRGPVWPPKVGQPPFQTQPPAYWPTPPGTRFADGTIGIAPTQQTCIGYVQAAVWYFQKKVGSLYPDVYTPGTVSGLDPHEPFRTTVETDRWKEVQAFRFLAHAASCLTSWFSIKDTVPAHMDLGTTGVTIPSAMINGFTSSGPGGKILIFDADIRYYHERAIYLIMQFSAMYPYDWAVPRPTNRTIMTDYPLLMSDMWTQPLIGQVFGMATTTAAAQWRPVSAEPIQHIGISSTYPVLNATSSKTPNFYDLPAGITALDAQMMQGTSPSSANSSGPLFGNIDHYTLAAPFAAAERCREIIFWSADWQSYEDFETLPSAPVDASKYPNSAPRSQNPYDNQLPKPFGSDPIWAVQRNMQERMGDIQFRDEQMFAFRNPEKCMLFKQDVSSMATGSSTTSIEVLNNPNVACPDQGSNALNEAIFNGLYGADRNFNQVLDRGPVPKSVRLRAQLVARFNFYDPRVPALLR